MQTLSISAAATTAQHKNVNICVHQHNFMHQEFLNLKKAMKQM
jgi:hypothetical protein